MSNGKKEMKYSPDAECEKMMQKLELIKQAKRLSIQKLAEEAEIAPSTLNELLHRRTRPQLYTIYKICNALNISIYELLEDTPLTVDSEEKEFMIKYRSLPKWKFQMLEEYLEMLIQYSKGGKQNDPWKTGTTE